MNIDVDAIVGEKLRQLDEDGVVQKAIEETVEKSLLSAIKDAIDSYKIKREIQEKVEKQISDAVGVLDFSSYNAIMVKRMREIINSYAGDDVANKTTEMLESLFVTKRESIRLSEIFEAYRKYAISEMDYDDHHSGDEFLAYYDPTDEHWAKVAFDKDANPTGDKEISFRLYGGYGDNVPYHITSLMFDGSPIDCKAQLGYLNDVEQLLVQCYYNKTPVIIDEEELRFFDNSYPCPDY